MMEVVIVDDGNRLTVYELVERVIPCIIAKHYSENYIQGFRSTFRNLLAYCNKNEKKYFTAELAQQFMLDCYGVQPGTVERRCSRVHRAMDLLSDYQHFNAVMLRRRLNREFPAGLQEGAVNYLQKLSLHGRRENTLRSHRNVLLRFTDYLFSVGVTDYKLLSADIVNRYVKVVSCNYSNSVVRLHYSILLRFFQYLAHSGYKETDLSLKMMPIVKVSASARIPTTLDLSQIESILTSVDRESPQGKRDYGAGVGFSGIFNEPLSLRVKQGVVTTVGVFVDFAVPYACKASGTGQTLAEAADAGEHIYKSNHRFDNEKRGNQCGLPLLVKYVIFRIEHLPPFRCHLVRRSRHQRFPLRFARP